MSTVLGIRESRWKKDSGEEVTTYYVSLRDDTGEREVPCYDAKAGDLKQDEPLPEGWEVKTSKAGKPYLATPRPARGGGGGGMAAYRNTAEGQAFEQERMDRRTALMQAVAHWPESWHVRANAMYEWLRLPLSPAQAMGAPAASPPPGRGTSSATPAERRGMDISVTKAAAHHAGVLPGVADARSVDTGSAEKSEGAVYGEGAAPSGTTPKGHKPGCTFPSVSEFRKDGATPLPEGKLRCTGCDAVLKESEVA